jgi:6-phosphogluconolactonase (cycloisomerase 2 family)
VNPSRAILLTLLSLTASRPAFAGTQLVCFGTFSKPYHPQAGMGIDVSPFNNATGHLNQPTRAAESYHPGFLEIHPDKTHLYATARQATPAP